MYARACRAWYGKRALKVVNDQIRHLQKRGDHKGVVIWGEVATQLSLLGIGPRIATLIRRFSGLDRDLGMRRKS